MGVEVPSTEQEANPAPAKAGWDNDTELQASLQQWGVAFCRAHRVGSFCNHYTRVRCCRTGWGYSMCGSTVHSSRCGWHVGWGPGHVGGWRFNQITSEQKPVDETPVDEPADVFPDETTGFDSLGPFEEEPSPEQEANPVPAKLGWENETACRLPRSTLGASPSARPTASGRSVIPPPRSDVAGHLGASQNAEPRCTRAVAVGALVVLFLEAARAGTSIQAGARAHSVVFTTQVSSAMATARCIVATITGTSWIAPPAPSHLGGVDESVGD